MILFLAAANLDAFSTFAGQRDGTIREVNPMYAHLSPTASLLVGEGVDVAQVLFWTKIVGPKHPKLAKVALYLSAGLRAYATARTLHTLNR